MMKTNSLKNREPSVCMNHYSNLQNWNYMSECRKFQDAFESTGLQCFVDCAFKHIDRDLINAFVERWYAETSTFHLPWGEMTITSYDVKNIFGTKIRGSMFEKPIDVDNVAGHKSYIVKLFGFDDESWNAIYKSAKGFTISLEALRERFKNRCSDQSDSKLIEYCVNAYWSYIIGNTIAVSKDGTHMPMIYCISLDEINEMDFDLTTCCLSYLFVELGKSSRAKCVQIGGYLTLLQNFGVNKVLGILNDAITKHSGNRTTPKVLLDETIKARDALENIPCRLPFALQLSESLLRAFSFQETQTDLVEE